MLDKNGVKDAQGKQANNEPSDDPIATCGRTARDVFMPKIMAASISRITWIVVGAHFASPSLSYLDKEGGANEFYQYFDAHLAERSPDLCRSAMIASGNSDRADKSDACFHPRCISD